MSNRCLRRCRRTSIHTANTDTLKTLFYTEEKLADVAQGTWNGKGSRDYKFVWNYVKQADENVSILVWSHWIDKADWLIDWLTLMSANLIRLYRRSCQAELLAQMAKDGRRKYNAHVVSRAFVHNICRGYMVFRHLLSETIRLTCKTL